MSFSSMTFDQAMNDPNLIYLHQLQSSKGTEEPTSSGSFLLIALQERRSLSLIGAIRFRPQQREADAPVNERTN
ncbi:hypothetical protein CEXT_399711 [Caerostris extrusa]|uniref:Uncharacterized protein n=1 Tax=Caerostris extrusa TaxID=172846 RepID=A0AAV4Q7R0_CAEEX|nr:hypothetical protein CEXT_399711 [Caerostris extrusa]